MKKYILVGIVISMCMVPSVVPAQTTSVSATLGTDVQAQIQSLLSQISLLKAQITLLLQRGFTHAPAGGPGTSTSTEPTIPPPNLCAMVNRTLTLGVKGEDVTGLQYFLLKQGFFTGTPSGEFDSDTAVAVQQFQARNSIVHSGNPLTTGWGVFGPRTREVFRFKWCNNIVLPSVIVPPVGSSTTGTTVCTTDFNPVCGQPPEPACRRSTPACMIATPASHTYSNRCMLDAEGARYLHDGACTTGDGLGGILPPTTQGTNDGQSPIISSFSGTSLLVVGQTGTWTMQAASPTGSALSYFINWGDWQQSSSADAYASSTSPTFTHLYQTAGTFHIYAKVIDATGRMGVATAKVIVQASSTSTATTTSTQPIQTTGTSCIGALHTYPEGTTVDGSLITTGAPYLGVAAVVVAMYQCRGGVWINSCAVSPYACTPGVERAYVYDPNVFGKIRQVDLPPTNPGSNPTGASCITPWSTVTVTDGGVIRNEPYFTGGNHTLNSVNTYDRCQDGHWVFLGTSPGNDGLCTVLEHSAVCNRLPSNPECTLANTPSGAQCGGLYHCTAGVVTFNENGFWSATPCLAIP